MANFKPINTGDVNSSALSRLVKRKILVFDVSCDQRDNVRQTFDIVYGSQVSRIFDITYSMIGQLAEKMEVDIPYSVEDTTPVRQLWDLPFSSRVRHEIDFRYHMVADLDDKMIVNLDYDVSSVNFVRKEWDTVFDLRSEISTVLENTTTLTYTNSNGASKVVEVLKASISMSEGDATWGCTVEISDVDIFAEFKRDDSFIISIDGEQFHFIADSLRQSRNGTAGQVLTIRGMSPTAKLMNPRANRIEMLTYPDDAFIATMATDIAALEGIDLIWDLPNFTVPAYTIAFADTTPMEALQYMAEALRGVVESTKDGQVIVRPTYRFRMDERIVGDEDHTYTFSEVFQASDLEETREVRNCVRLMNKEVSNSDVIEWTQDAGDNLKGELRVWLSPPRDTAVLRTTRNDVALSFIGTYTEKHTETVEIVDSVGSVSKPIYGIDCAEWLDTDLGDIIYEQYTTELKSSLPQDTTEDLTDSISLMRITYVTQYQLYSVEAERYDPAQFVLEDIEEV